MAPRSKPKTVTVIDNETGEVRDEVFLVQRRQARISEDWIMLMQDTMCRLAEHGAMGLQEWRVLALLLGKLDFENWIRLPQTAIAARLHMRPSNVSRALARLVEIGLLAKGPRVAGGHTYRLNSQAAWKGKVASLRGHRRNTKEPRLRLVHSAQDADGVSA